MVQHIETYAFDDDEAVARLRALTDYWAAKHGVVATWTGSSATMKGRKLGVKYDARVVLSNGTLTADVEVGFLAKKLGGHEYVLRKLADYLDPARSVESLRARIPSP